MTFEELLQKIHTEPDRAEVLDGRTLRTGHVLGAPLRHKELEAWLAAWPSHRLPADLVSLLLRANGIHLWADLDTGRSYTGIAPLAEWKLARLRMWGGLVGPEEFSDRYLALSYHVDGSAYIVLNVDSGMYFFMDPCAADESSVVGASVSELLDWVWEYRLP